MSAGGAGATGGTGAPAPASPDRAAARAIGASAATLAALGVLFVFSATAPEADGTASQTVLLRRQTLWVTLAGLSLCLTWQTEIATFMRWRRWIYGAAVLGLVLVLIPGVGTERYGSARWIRFGSVGCQPSEAMKLAIVCLLAGEATARHDRIRSFKEGFLPLFAPVALACGLTAVEPDLGTTAFLFAVSVVVLLVAGVRLLHLALCGLPLLAGAAALLYGRFGYIRDRVRVFLDPDLDPLGAGYQIRQSLMALASGGVGGRGLGDGRQKILHLPFDHNDFVLAVVGEEIGLVGTLLVVGLFALLLWGGIRAARRARSLPGLLVAVGITLGITLQAAIHVAVVTASMPSKGIPLPLVSFGGSSMVVTGAAIGLLLRVAEDGGAGVDGTDDPPSGREECPDDA